MTSLMTLGSARNDVRFLSIWLACNSSFGDCPILDDDC